MSPTILAVETSTAACSVALLHGSILYQRYEVLPQKHAHRLLGMVNEVMEESGLKGSSIDLLAFGEGPGAFTGVRIAAGVIQGLALGWDKPVVAISSLEAMAENVLFAKKELFLTGESNHKNNLERCLENKSEINCKANEVIWCAMMDARMQEVYVQSGSYNLQTGVLQADSIKLLTPEAAESEVIALGEGCVGLGDIRQVYPGLVKQFADWTDTLPTATSVAKLAMQAREKAYLLTEKVPLPVYLRNQVADTIAQRELKSKLKLKAL